MPGDAATLERLVAFLGTNDAVAEKWRIGSAYSPAVPLAGGVAIGDDCAAIPDGDGWLLLAAEGMLESFVADDPWFAGYSAVMVNLSDVAAMGGRPLGIVDVLWTPTLRAAEEIWAGMSAAAQAYAAPIVGGHTTIARSSSQFLAAAVLGKAKRLITSFDAREGDDLLLAVDLRGTWRGDKPFWNASTGAPSERLRADLALLPVLAENGWCHAGRDVSNGGIVGTLAMLIECSRVGAELWLDRLPQPPEVPLERWLVAFPSFGYLLSVAREQTDRVIALFAARDIACGVVGSITGTRSLVLGFGAARVPFSVPGPAQAAEAPSRLRATAL
jgi:AIR synthase-related protein